MNYSHTMTVENVPTDGILELEIAIGPYTVALDYESILGYEPVVDARCYANTDELPVAYSECRSTLKGHYVFSTANGERIELFIV